MKGKDEALVIMAELISLGLIKEYEKDKWELTREGRVVADKAMSKLTQKEQALCLLKASLLIRGGE